MDSKNAGEKIRQLRQEKAWTQEELAAQASISPRTVQRAEEGQMSADTLKAIAHAFHVPVESISVAEAPGQPRLSPVLYYEAADTLDWLVDAFGLELRVRIPDAEGRVVHGELYLDDCRIIVGQPIESRKWTTPGVAGVNTQSVYALVDDVDAHYEHAKAQGAEILLPPEDMHGDRRYLAADPEGHHWWFVTPIRS